MLAGMHQTADYSTLGVLPPLHSLKQQENRVGGKMMPRPDFLYYIIKMYIKALFFDSVYGVQKDVQDVSA